MIRVFAGFDSGQESGYAIFCESLQAHSSQPVSIAPLRLSQLTEHHTRPRSPLQSTDFAFTRFLVPWLCNYQGWALFCDGADMVLAGDISRLWELRDEKYAVMVCKKTHTGKETAKFRGAVQVHYPKKNWSSVMLFNCAKCTELRPEDVNEVDGSYLHQFRWCKESEIGELPDRWNYLVGIDEYCYDPDIIHFTLGSPLFCDYNDKNRRYVALWKFWQSVVAGKRIEEVGNVLPDIRSK